MFCNTIYRTNFPGHTDTVSGHICFILHTRLRHQCSSLNADLSKIHIINNFKCNCGASFEDAIHYFLECPLYLNERRTLLSNCDDININIEDNVGEFLIDISRLFQSETVDGIDELADVLSLHLGGT
jgi:hypothetical protein